MSPKVPHSYNIGKTIFHNFKPFPNNVWSQIHIRLWYTKPHTFHIVGMAKAGHLTSQDRPPSWHEICQTSDATYQVTCHGNKA